MERKKIQDRLPPPGTVRREVLWSLSSIFIFSVCSTFVYQLIKTGQTNLYFKWNEQGWLYFVISPLICIILHDAYYYWMHRIMHSQYLFRYFHRVHHLSVTPTPWAIYSFQPLEAFFTFLSFALIIVYLPIHPVAFGVYMLISLVNNIGGHTGYELLPAWFAKHRILKYATVVTFHDMHHTNLKYNFGAYFNIWDRIMNTVHKDYEKKFQTVAGANNENPKK